VASRSVGLDVIIRTLSAGDGLDKVTKGVDSFKTGIQKAALPAAAVAGAIGAVGLAAVNAASDVEQSMGALDSVFGKNADVVKKWAQSAAQDVGLSKAQYGQLAAGLGAQLKNLGLGADQALGGTKDLITLGADLSAAFGGTAAEAVEALGSALRGEADPAEKYGLSLNQTKVNAKLAEKGLSGLTGTALTAAKAQAVMELATEQAGGAVGQFARESDTAAGSAQRNQAAWQDTLAVLGTALLPVVTKLTDTFKDLANWVSENSTTVMILAGIIGGLAAAVLLINAGLAIYEAVTIAAAAAQWLFNTALFAFPLTWIVIAIVLVVAAIILLWNKCEWFRNAVTAVWDWIKAVWATSVEAIKSFMSSLADNISNIWNNIKGFFSSAIDNIKGWLQSLGDFFGKIPGWLSSALGTVWNVITAPFRSAIDAVRGYVDWFSSMFAPVVGWISGALSGIYNAITAPFRTAIDWVKGAIDGIKGAWNSVARGINGVSVTFGPIPDWVPGIGGNSWTFDPPNLPTLAAGGWVTRPTLALIGEGRSAEIVAPEPMLRRVLREEAGGSRHYTVNVTVAAGVAPAEVGRQIVDQIRAFERAAGPGWRAA
jgi:hypothetical protein